VIAMPDEAAVVAAPWAVVVPDVGTDAVAEVDTTTADPAFPDGDGVGFRPQAEAALVTPSP
jgi:hypothetical protein